MKMWKKLLTSVLTVALLLGLSAGSAYAAEKETYKYTVTFYAGNQGTFAGTEGLSVDNAAAVVTQSADMIKVTGLEAGDVVSLNAQATVALGVDSKYYVQGVRLSGRDNDTVAASVFRVDADADYVVAYGIKGNVTAYTVNYQDRNGNTLAESDTFYGNVGDKPVVAYKYIEGYAPEAFGLTKTLSENEAENVFTFVYEEAPTPTIQEIPVPGTGTRPDGTGEGTNAGETGEETDAPGANEGTGTTEKEEEKQPIKDLDEDTPLGNPDLDKDDMTKGLPLAASLAILAAAVAGLIVLLLLILKKRKTN